MLKYFVECLRVRAEGVFTCISTSAGCELNSHRLGLLYASLLSSTSLSVEGDRFDVSIVFSVYCGFLKRELGICLVLATGTVANVITSGSKRATRRGSGRRTCGEGCIETGTYKCGSGGSRTFI